MYNYDRQLKMIISDKLRRATREGKWLRKRDIISPANRAGQIIFNELEKEGHLVSRLVEDKANMESFYVYQWRA
jgi:hypothetical protein